MKRLLFLLITMVVIESVFAEKRTYLSNVDATYVSYSYDLYELNNIRNDSDFDEIPGNPEILCVPPVVYIENMHDTIFCGSSFILQASPITPGNSGTWELVSGGFVLFSNPSHNITTVEVASSGIYRIKWTERALGGGMICSDSEEITVHVYLEAANVEICDDIYANTCDNIVELSVTADQRLNITWNADNPNSVIENPNSFITTAIVSETTTFYAFITDPRSNECSYMDSVIVYFSDLPEPEICVVNVENNKNVIYWNKDETDMVDHYSIYRSAPDEDNYSSIGTVPYNELSLFTDMDFDPEISNAKYKIAANYTCNVESELSGHHKTIFLEYDITSDSGFLLNWSAYEGLDFGEIQLFRGLDPDNLSLLITLSNEESSHIDYFSSSEEVYYQIRVLLLTDCEPTKANSYFSSNIIKVLPDNVGTEIYNNIYNINIFPNPAQDYVNIEIEDNISFDVKIFNSIGNILFESLNNKNNLKIDILNFKSGTYMVEVYTIFGLSKYKLIKN